MVKEIWITKAGSYDVLQVKEREDPVVEKGQVKIKIKACGLNFSEIMARQGLYPGAKAPCVVGYESAGVISEIGEGVTDLKIGDRVMVMTLLGGNADTIVTVADHVTKIDDSMTFAEAASIPVNYVTAYHMIHRIAHVKPGDRVLVHMAAGGVGVAAIQILKAIGNVTIIGTASAKKHEFIRELGCTHPIDYTTQDFATEITKLYKDEIEGRRGVDVILDPLGELKAGYNILNPCGHIISFGVANFINGPTRSLFNIVKQYFRIPSFNPLNLMTDNKTVSGVHLAHLIKPATFPMVKQELTEILELFRQGKCRAIISKEFTFDQAGEAHRYMEERNNIGKIIIVPTEADLTK